jgi:glycosyltransferase involved in cell wall biosynthesis
MRTTVRGSTSTSPETGVPPDVTVVVPVYRNAPTLRELCRRIRAVLDARARSYELVFVDDASPDESLAVLDELKQQGSTIVLPLSSNLGQHRAVLSGLRRATGRTVVVMDADLQDPPEAIPLLLDRLQEGFAAVYAARRGRYQSLFRRLTSRLFKAWVHVVAGVPTDMGPFTAMDRRMVDAVLSRAPHRPFIPALIAGAGLPIASVPVLRAPRPIGRSAYTNWDRLAMAASVVGGIVRSRRRNRTGSPPGP